MKRTGEMRRAHYRYSSQSKTMVKAAQFLCKKSLYAVTLTKARKLRICLRLNIALELCALCRQHLYLQQKMLLFLDYTFKFNFAANEELWKIKTSPQFADRGQLQTTQLLAFNTHAQKPYLGAISLINLFV